MKMVKSLLLGSAAGVVAMTGAQAADLPVKAKPVQYVKICSLYGAGFWYIPGTNTCIKLGGWVRTEYNINSLGSFNPNKSTDFTRGDTENTIRNRGIMTWDVREQTEYGTLRAYIAGGWQDNNASAGQIYAPRAFIQFAGFTLGKATSFYDFYATPWYSNTTNVWGSDTGGGGKTVWGYTAQFGNGLSGSIALEDPQAAQKGIVGTGGPYSAGPQLPDLTGNMHIDSSWGSAQIAGALHQVYAKGDGVLHPDDKVGWAIGAGLKVNLPWAKGDSFAIEGDYTEGAIAYAGSGIGSFAWSRGATYGQGTASDATVVGGAGGTLHLTSAWSVVAGVDHHWDAHWNTSLYGSYGEVMPYEAPGQDLKWNFGQVGSRTVWAPVKNLQLSVDVMYLRLGTDHKYYGSSDQSTWQAILRAQRNFYP
jgi:hypothetical protein